MFLTDSMDDIKDKIKRYAFSGAPSTLAELKANGADLDADVSYQYLRFFCDDDALLEDVGRRYKAGEMNTGEVKDEIIRVGRAVLRHRLRSLCPYQWPQPLNWYHPKIISRFNTFARMSCPAEIVA